MNGKKIRNKNIRDWQAINAGLWELDKDELPLIFDYRNVTLISKMRVFSEALCPKKRFAYTIKVSTC